MAMEMASCTGSLVVCPSSLPISMRARRALSTARPHSFLQQHRSLNCFSLPRAADSNSPASATDSPASDQPKTAVDPPSFSSEGAVESETDGKQSKEQEELGKALSQMRQERLALGKEDPSSTEEFWRGVLAEIRLIEWPSIQKVLGTTGVVMGIIVGSSLVLLTVNAILAQLSDKIFNNAPPV